MRKKKATARLYDISLSVLGYREDGVWVALALEMDIRGRGKSFADAIADLKDLVFMQIGFAFFKGQPEMVLRPADPVYFQIFSDLRRAWLASRSVRAADSESEYQIASLPIPPAHTLAEHSGKYSLTNA